MPKTKAPNYTVIQDTREQDGWWFTEYDKCDGMEVGTLTTGDYTIKGFEDVVCVERKGSTSEIAMNLGRKKAPFQAEVERMKDYSFAFIVCEFSMDDLLQYPEKSRVPRAARSQVKVTGKYLLKCLLEIQVCYNVRVLLCGNKNNAFVVCNSLFKRLNEMFHGQNKN